MISWTLFFFGNLENTGLSPLHPFIQEPPGLKGLLSWRTKGGISRHPLAIEACLGPLSPQISQSVFLDLKNHQPQLIIKNNGISEKVLVLLSCSLQISSQTSLYPLHPLTHELYEQLLVRNKRQTTVHLSSTPFFNRFAVKSIWNTKKGHCQSYLHIAAL